MGRYEFITFIVAVAIGAAVAVAWSSALVSVLIRDDDPPMSPRSQVPANPRTGDLAAVQVVGQRAA
jgi:hypothetical protein